jgi:hypothetical protein
MAERWVFSQGKREMAHAYAVRTGKFRRLPTVLDRLMEDG